MPNCPLSDKLIGKKKKTPNIKGLISQNPKDKKGVKSKEIQI